MKNIIAIISAVIVFALMISTYTKGPAFHGGEAGAIIEDMKNITSNTTNVEQPKQNDNIEEDKLRALRDKAGNTATFEVSNEYKSKCASCHGVDGSGIQNGKKLMGSAIFGQTEDELYKKLVDYKSGRKENLIMKGLLLNLSEEDLKRFAKEISEFKARKEASK